MKEMTMKKFLHLLDNIHKNEHLTVITISNPNEKTFEISFKDSEYETIRLTGNIDHSYLFDHIMKRHKKNLLVIITDDDANEVVVETKDFLLIIFKDLNQKGVKWVEDLRNGVH